MTETTKSDSPGPKPTEEEYAEEVMKIWEEFLDVDDLLPKKGVRWPY